MNPKIAALRSIGFAIACLYILGCGSDNEDHIFDIGGRYGIDALTLKFPSGGTFSFSEVELYLLDNAWDYKNASVDLINDVSRGAPLTYHIKLSDGFEMEFDGSIREVDGKHFLYLSMLGDGGGFSGDVISHLSQLDDVLDDDRIEQLFEDTR